LTRYSKTVLSVAILDYLTNKNNTLILSFFFNFSDTRKQTLDYILRISSTFYLNSLFKVYQNSINQCIIKELSDTVFKILIAQKKVFIILDVLDKSTTRNKYNLLNGVNLQRSPNLKIFLKGSKVKEGPYIVTARSKRDIPAYNCKYTGGGKE
ncbi:Pfs NACHT and ankyrin domain protein, partial [Penicillium cosmopolitanum]